MNFESLSSEIIFEIFDFLDDSHIFHTFHNLNSRYNDLLLTYFRVSPHLNLQFIPKTDFNNVCQYILPLMTDQIQSLCLSNDDHTPQQIDLFLSYGLTLNKFLYLKSLSLHHMHSKQIINRMMMEWQYLVYLTHLNIIHCQISNDWNIIYSLMDNIWSLPELTHCQLDINVIDQKYSIIPTVISTTLQSLSIKNIHYNFEELIHLFEYTPYLRYLDITINEKNINHSYLAFSLPLMTTLKLTYEGPFSALKNLLRTVPNLRHWTMRTKNVYMEGQQWAEIIRNHLSKLKVFHLLMEFDPENSRFYLVELVRTYKSDFWLNEHKWYVQGYCCGQHYQDAVVVYTVPYTFNDYYIAFKDGHASSKSYFSNDDDQISYKYVHDLFCMSLPKYTYPFRNRFSHIHHLTLILPFNNNFWICVPTFDQLRLLNISLLYTEAYNEDASFQLQTLLERAPKLYSLTVKSSIDSLLPLLESTSESIVKLDFQDCEDYFSHSNCATLFLSSLGKQCKILSIKVNDQMSILELVKEIPELQTLHVEFPSKSYKIDFSLSSNDELIKCLQHQLPSTCTITQDSINSNRIQIWIR